MTRRAPETRTYARVEPIGELEIPVRVNSAGNVTLTAELLDTILTQLGWTRIVEEQP